MATGSEQLTRAMRSLEAAFLIGIEGVTEIWLIRHADAYDDPIDSDDPPLSALGRDQAARLAQRVHRATPDAIYASPYRRALETAQAISDDVRVEPRLVEMALDISDNGFDFKEPYDDVVARMRAVIDELTSRHEGRRVIAVGHGMAITVCLGDILRLEPGRLRILPYYTSVSVVRALGDRRMVGGIGDVGHLE